MNNIAVFEEVLQDDFYNLHAHTMFSNECLLDSINKVETVILYVANVLKQKGVAITDHETVSAHPEALQVVERLKAENKIPQDFKLILGNEIYLVSQEDYEHAIIHNKPTRFFHFILLAKNKQGHQQIRELSSRAWRRARTFRGMERRPTFYSDIEDIVGNNKGNLVASTACLGSRFSRLALEFGQMELAIKQGFYFDYFTKQNVEVSESDATARIEELRELIHEFLSWGVDMFGEDCYIEIQPSHMEDQIIYNKVAHRIASAYGIPMIVTTDAHYMRKEDRTIHEAYLNADNEGAGDREVADFYSTTYYFTSQELHEYLDYLGADVVNELIANTKTIANKIEEYSLAHNQVIPKIPLPPEEEWDNSKHGAIYEVMNQIPHHFPSLFDMFYSEEPYDRYLVHQCFNGLVERIPVEDYAEYLTRLNLEFEEVLGVSKAKQEPISSYFITMQKIIDIIWETGSIVGTGRGSAGCFLVNYLLQIVQIDPLRQGVKLDHWRFLHKSKVEIPKTHWGWRVNLA